jgi:hypothetical protein
MIYRFTNPKMKTELGYTRFCDYTIDPKQWQSLSKTCSKSKSDLIPIGSISRTNVKQKMDGVGGTTRDWSLSRLELRKRSDRLV